MSNLPTLQQNTLHGFSETAQSLYLTLLDKFQGWNSPSGEMAAFIAADHYERKCGDVLDHILRNAPVWNLPADVMSELSKFFAERWRHNFMGES